MAAALFYTLDVPVDMQIGHFNWVVVINCKVFV